MAQVVTASSDKIVRSTVRLGIYSRNSALIRAMVVNNMHISDRAKYLIERVKIFHTERVAHLVSMSLVKLGMHRGAVTKDIYDFASKRGLYLCPAEVGPIMRLAFTDQPVGQHHIIAMEPIIGLLGKPAVFGLSNKDGEKWLIDYEMLPDTFWKDRTRFVFLESK